MPRDQKMCEPEVGKCFYWSRSCKPTAWRGNQPENQSIIHIFGIISSFTWHILFFFQFTWHIGLRTALQVCLAQVTGSYWIGGKSGRSWKGCVKASEAQVFFRADMAMGNKLPRQEKSHSGSLSRDKTSRIFSDFPLFSLSFMTVITLNLLRRSVI